MSRIGLRGLLLESYTRDTLLSICHRLGLNKTGNKIALVDRIHGAVRDVSPLPPHARILSIDLGLRNLAFSLLEAPKPSRKGASTAKKASDPWLTLTARPPPRLLDWNVVALIPRDGGTAANLDPAASEADKAEDVPASPPDGTFSPSSLATIAVSAVRDLIMPLKPTHILLERQRWRSGGGPVLEWTLRINSLEAMLHAALELLRIEGRWKGEVHSVEPRMVVGSIDTAVEEEEKTVRGRGMGKDTYKVREEGPAKKQKTKKIKMDHIATILEGVLRGAGPGENRTLTLGTDAARQKSLYYLQKVRGKKFAETLPGPEKSIAAPADWQHLAKVDDLADSLLQGLAWFEWRMQRLNLRDAGVLDSWGPEEETGDEKRTKRVAAARKQAMLTEKPKKETRSRPRKISQIDKESEDM